MNLLKNSIGFGPKLFWKAYNKIEPQRTRTKQTMVFMLKKQDGISYLMSKEDTVVKSFAIRI